MRSENLVQAGLLSGLVDDYVSLTSGMLVDGVADEPPRPCWTVPATAAGSDASKYLRSRRKRLLDIGACVALLLLFAPLLLLVAIAVAITSPGPVVFRQLRGGVHFRPFTILKFRTMHVHDSEPELRQAVRGDARVTPLGQLLRMTSADELPQFINVLKGDMSLVGPRPHSISHDRIYMTRVDGYAKRFQCKPGITGLAQVSGLRGATETDDLMQKRVDADLEYLRTASLRGDLAIMFRTASRVLTCRDAY